MQENSTTTRCYRKGLRFAAGLCLFVLVAVFPSEADEGWYVEPRAFLEQAFDDVPDASLLWLTGERGEVAHEILGHAAPSLRVRYWQDGDRTAWILEEIGREKPITAGFVVEDSRLVSVRVLAFRESRGWEIKHEFFTEQFDGIGLAAERTLDESIDNITGATLSVNAMRRMARLALYFDSEVQGVAP